MAELKKVDIFCDGACSGNPGPGGWAAILRYGRYEKTLSGGEALTTNNRMELTALIRALGQLKESCCVSVYTDSQYLINGVTKGWALSWKRRGWRKPDNKPALNPELWDELLMQLEKHKYSFIWVKGHAGHPENERCDSMAVTEAKKFL